VEEIIARLGDVAGSDRGWAQAVIAELKTRAPLSLKVTHRHIRGAASLDLSATLVIDYRLACRFLDGHDFYEGVRAALIDKDGAPKWQPATLNEVSAGMVDAYFAAVGAAELILPTRPEMQAARV
jgi:enoyl-CoA hydratase